MHTPALLASKMPLETAAAFNGPETSASRSKKEAQQARYRASVVVCAVFSPSVWSRPCARSTTFVQKREWSRAGRIRIGILAELEPIIQKQNIPLSDRPTPDWLPTNRGLDLLAKVSSSENDNANGIHADMSRTARTARPVLCTVIWSQRPGEVSENSVRFILS